MTRPVLEMPIVVIQKSHTNTIEVSHHQRIRLLGVEVAQPDSAKLRAGIVLKRVTCGSRTIFEGERPLGEPVSIERGSAGMPLLSPRGADPILEPGEPLCIKIHNRTGFDIELALVVPYDALPPKEAS